MKMVTKFKYSDESSEFELKSQKKYLGDNKNVLESFKFVVPKKLFSSELTLGEYANDKSIFTEGKAPDSEYKYDVNTDKNDYVFSSTNYESTSNGFLYHYKSSNKLSYDGNVTITRKMRVYKDVHVDGSSSVSNCMNIFDFDDDDW